MAPPRQVLALIDEIRWSERRESRAETALELVIEALKARGHEVKPLWEAEGKEEAAAATPPRVSRAKARGGR